jgi:hypothetical protein
VRNLTIKHRLGWLYRQLLLNSILLFPLVVVFEGIVLQMYRRKETPLTAADLSVVTVLVLLLGLYILALAGAAWTLRNLDRHPDLVRLARYGPLAELLPSIEAELADPGQVAKVGRMLQTFQLRRGRDNDLGYEEVWLTPSWVIYLTRQGTRLQFFALDSLVLAARVGNSVLLIDDRGERVEIPGTPAGVTRLLAEILARVPWALNRFDSEMEKSWTENRQEIVAEVSRRREQIKVSRSADGEPPG